MTKNIEQTTYSAILGAVVSSIRREKGIEQTEVANKMGLSQASYSRLEGGKATFSIDQVFVVSTAIEISTVELLERVSTTIEKLESGGINVTAQQRSNSTGNRDPKVGTLIAGATLGALLVGLLSKSK